MLKLVVGLFSVLIAIELCHSYSVIYYTNFDNDQAFTFGSFNGNPHTWAWGYPNDATVKNCISGKCIKTNLVGNYYNFEFSYAETPSISFVGISGGSQIYLNFSAVFKFDGLGQDGVSLRYSTDNKNTWKTLGNASSGGLNWYNTANVPQLNTIGNGISVYGPPPTPGWYRAATNDTWQRIYQILPQSLIGQSSVYFRFFFGSDNANVASGVTLDNFGVYSNAIASTTGSFITTGFSIPTSSSVLYAQSFEQSNHNWKVGFFSGSATSPAGFQWGTPNYYPVYGCASGTKCLKTNLLGQYGLYQAAYANSPKISLASVAPNTALILAVNITYQFDFLKKDGCVVRYSLDNSTWTVLGSATTGTNWYTASRVFGFESFSFPGGTPGWNGLQATWTTAYIPLPLSVSGVSEFYLQFAMATSPTSSSNAGIAIDDVIIMQGVIPTGGSTPTPSGGQTNTDQTSSGENTNSGTKISDDTSSGTRIEILFMFVISIISCLFCF